MTWNPPGASAFAEAFTAATDAFCSIHTYPPVSAGWRENFDARIPIGLRTLLGEALASGAIEIPAGTAGVRLRDQPTKGPYALFSRSSTSVPAPNWEYYVQLAEYARLMDVAPRRAWSVGFEDGLMDVSVYSGDTLLWCIEVKEQSKGLSSLAEQIGRHGRGIDWAKEDRHDDPLRKAKYLATKQPMWFSLVAIGERHDFSVSYDGERFELRRDVLPA